MPDNSATENRAIRCHFNLALTIGMAGMGIHIILSINPRYLIVFLRIVFLCPTNHKGRWIFGHAKKGWLGVRILSGCSILFLRMVDFIVITLFHAWYFTHQKLNDKITLGLSLRCPVFDVCLLSMSGLFRNRCYLFPVPILCSDDSGYSARYGVIMELIRWNAFFISRFSAVAAASSFLSETISAFLLLSFSWSSSYWAREIVTVDSDAVLLCR